MAETDGSPTQRAFLYRLLGITTGLSISIGGFALGFILNTIQSDIAEIKTRIAPDILPRAEERFESVELRVRRNEMDIAELDNHLYEHMRDDHD